MKTTSFHEKIFFAVVYIDIFFSASKIIKNFNEFLKSNKKIFGKMFIKIERAKMKRELDEMKKIFGLMAIALLILCNAVSVEAAKKVVAVMPLENVSGFNEYRVAEVMTENLMVEIANSGNYTVSERVQAGRILQEQGFQNLTSSNPVETGEMTGADYSVVGKVTMAVITQNTGGNVLSNIMRQIDGGQGTIIGHSVAFINQLKAKVAMDVRFVDNKTGEVIFAKTFEGSKSGQNPEMALNAACKVAAQNFLQEIQSVNPFAARIVEISGSEIYIDEGSEKGLRKGETLTVARESTPIIVKGKVVAMKTNAICKVKVIEVNAEYSICKAEGNASAIRKGDVVKRG